MLGDWEDKQTTAEYCDACGAPLAPEDESIHLCKVCQGIEE